MAFTWEFAKDFTVVIVVIVSAVLGYHAPEIGTFLFQLVDFQ